MSPDSGARSVPPAPPGQQDHRFPGFDVLSQADHWDDATASLVRARVQGDNPVRFFDPHEFDTASALIGQLVDQDETMSRTLCATVDARLADTQTDGWHYENMPRDDETWRRTVVALDEEARHRYGITFAEASRDQRDEILADINALGDTHWHDLPARRLFDLWMRYACTAYYAHPSAWNEIGFPGPAYPRGYKNIGIDRREPFEVADARPNDDPIAQHARRAADR